MSAIIPQVLPQALPPPRIAISIRPGTMQDLPFLDRLQKLHTKQVGWMPTRQLEGKVGAGHVLIAECPSPQPSPGVPGEGVKLGYLIGSDQYFKRDDVGIIYQLNVAPSSQRKLVGAMLLKAQFERSAYGCKLYCCWCAQDIEANRFWESMGFVPLAFRAGSEKKRRVHIFWQKRIRSGDDATPWWFPSETKGGSMMEDRLVFPIPPGTHWSDAKPIVLPRDTHRDTQPRQLEGPGARTAPKKMKPAVWTKPAPLCGGLRFAPPVAPEEKTEKPKPTKKPKVKNDPKFVAAARELRDRWLEKVNADPSVLMSAGKYEVNRALPSPASPRALPAAA